MWVYTNSADGRMLIELESGVIVRALESEGGTFSLLRTRGQERFTLAHFDTEEKAYKALDHLAKKIGAEDMGRDPYVEVKAKFVERDFSGSQPEP